MTRQAPSRWDFAVLGSRQGSGTNECTEILGRRAPSLVLPTRAGDCGAPLGTDTRVGEAMKKIAEGVRITPEWWAFARNLRSQLTYELRELSVRKSRMPMMHAMVRFVEQSK
jgi:hypothetical protein